MKSGILNFLEPSGPVQACNGIALPLPYSSVLLCTQKKHVVNYGCGVTQSHPYFQVHLLGFLKMSIYKVAVCDHRNKDRWFHFLVMHYNESSRRIRGSELTMLLSPQVHGVRIIAD